MLRLTRKHARSHEVTLQAEGQIVAEWVALLEEIRLLHDLAGKPYPSSTARRCSLSCSGRMPHDRGW
jgi:hypothetical protein